MSTDKTAVAEVTYSLLWRDKGGVKELWVGPFYAGSVRAQGGRWLVDTSAAFAPRHTVYANDDEAMDALSHAIRNGISK